MELTNETYKVLVYVRNVENLYNMVQSAATCIEKKINKGINVDFNILVNSSVVSKIVTELNKCLQKYDNEKLSTQARKEAKNIIATEIIDQANENIEYKKENN